MVRFPVMKTLAVVFGLGIVGFLLSLAYSFGKDTIGTPGTGDDLMTVLGIVAGSVTIIVSVTMALRPILKRVDSGVCEINNAVNNSPIPLTDRIDEMTKELRMNSKMVEVMAESQATLGIEMSNLSTRLDEHIGRK